MSTVLPLFVKRPGLIRGDGVPICVQVDLTVELLVRALSVACTLETVERVRAFECRAGRQVQALEPTTIGPILATRGTAGPRGPRPIRRIAAHVTMQFYPGVNVDRARDEAAAWWAGVEPDAPGIGWAVRRQRWAEFQASR